MIIVIVYAPLSLLTLHGAMLFGKGTFPQVTILWYSHSQSPGENIQSFQNIKGWWDCPLCWCASLAAQVQMLAVSFIAITRGNPSTCCLPSQVSVITCLTLEVVFCWGHIPLRLYSVVVVFHWCYLLLRSFSSEDGFRYSSVDIVFH